MFGEWGGLILQFTITVVVVLGLIAVVYWLVQRYSAGGLGRLNRGRMPRLAVIDAMAIDGRRRLVLVRRDNVEHLILLGGPSDVVVEQSIQRPRQRPIARPQAIGPAAEMAPAPAESSVSPPENPLIPFPQSRIHQATVHQPTSMAERTFAPSRRTQPQQPARFEAASTPEPVASPFQAITESLPLIREPTPFETPVYEPRTVYAPYTGTNGNIHPAHRDYGSSASHPAAASPFIAPAPADSETAAKVNDLEREMARLLGEITANRPS